MWCSNASGEEYLFMHLVHWKCLQRKNSKIKTLNIFQLDCSYILHWIVLFLIFYKVSELRERTALPFLNSSKIIPNAARCNFFSPKLNLNINLTDLLKYQLFTCSYFVIEDFHNIYLYTILPTKCTSNIYFSNN